VALLIGSGASGFSPQVERSGDGARWLPVEVVAVGGGPRRLVLRLEGVGRGGQVRVTLERPRPASEPSDRMRVEGVGLFASEVGLRTDIRRFLRGVPDRQLYNGRFA